MPKFALRSSSIPILLAAALLAPPIDAQCAEWSAGFGSATANDALFALTTINLGQGPSLYAVGQFTAIGQSAASIVARFDGTAWSSFGGNPGGRVFAIEGFDDGTGPAAYIGGQFPGRAAKWIGSTWVTLGTGLGGTARALAVYDDGSGPALYATGLFFTAGGASAMNIAKWDGTSWSPLGSGIDIGVSGSGGFALAVHDDGTGAALYVGGDFSQAGGLPAKSVAKWNGATWSPLGAGIGGTGSWEPVFALRSYGATGSPPRLIAAGMFASAGGVTAQGIASWDGVSWSALGGGSDGVVNELSIAGGALHAGGSFTQMGGVATKNVARWDGSAWSPVGIGVDYAVTALANFDDGSGEAVFAAGPRASSVPNDTTYAVERFNGSAWKDTVRNRGLDGPVAALTTFDDGTGRALIASGEFVHAGEATVNGLARWDGTEWTTLGNGIDGFARALFSFDDGNGEALYAGGTGIGFGGVPGSNIARWDGATWSGLGSGTNDFVRALTAFDDGSGIALYAGGRFTTAGGIGAQHIAKWNGSTWSALGNGLNDAVIAMTTFDDGGGPALYVGGAFTSAGGISANRVARWDGTSWSALGSGLNASVFTLAAFDDGSGLALYAGGMFTASGAVPAKWIARWNGSSWSPVGPYLHGTVRALCTFDDGSGSGTALYACGMFEVYGYGSGGSNIARWDGTTWSPLGMGLTQGNPFVAERAEALAVLDDGSGHGADLYVGGEFDTAAPAAAKNIARWKGCGGVGGLVCFGDDSSGACPCGNASPVGAREGCLNSLALGATLRGSGSTSLSRDSLVLHAAQMSSGSALYVQGSRASVTGFAIGDGLSCVDGVLVRLGVTTSASGSSTFPTASGASVSSAGQVHATGMRVYQVHYRDQASYCTPSTFNFTNALRVLWSP